MVKTEIVNSETLEGNRYPILKKHKNTNLYVLFSSPEKGTIIFNDNNLVDQVGEYRTDWIDDMFEYTTNTIMVKNI